MKKAILLAATLALLSAPALAQKGGGGVQEGQDSAMSPPQGRAGVSGSSGRAGMTATTGASRSTVKSKKAKKSKRSGS